MADNLMPVGDVQSNEKGSGARANSNKPDWSLMPLDQITFLMEKNPSYDLHNRVYKPDCTGMLQMLADIQSLANTHSIEKALYYSVLLTMQNNQKTFIEVMEEVIAVWEMGKKKYAPFNWMKGMPWSVPLACSVRHLLKMWKGVSTDQESGRLHGAHLICNLMMLCHYVDYYPEGNDLPHQWYSA
jgi:hypothetical protein